MDDWTPTAENDFFSSDLPASIHEADATIKVHFETVLIYSARTWLEEPPSCVYPREHWTVANLFKSLTGKVRFQSKPEGNMSSVQASFSWD